jgi:hypothetical protein
MTGYKRLKSHGLRWSVLPVLLAAAFMFALSAPAALAHQGGHQGGCAEFGSLVSEDARDLGPEFGQGVGQIAKTTPGALAEAIEQFYHEELCAEQQN